MSFNAFNAVRTSARRAANFTAPAARSSRQTLRTNGFRRGYSTTEPPASGTGQKTSYTLPIGVGAVLAAAGGYYFLTSDAPRQAETLGKEAVQIAKAATHFTPSKEDYQKVYNEIIEVMESDEATEYDDGSFGPVFLRLAWHASGTYDVSTNTGGSNYATMRFEPEALHGANAGLKLARELLQKVKDKYDWISYGDLWTLAGVAAIQEMGGPKVAWRPGRIDGFAKDATPDGRLPDASLGSDHLRHIFYRMGFNDQEIVALSGAHALGRCHPDRSGFEGPWTFSPTTLTNDYYKLLFDEKWVWRKWNGPAQYADKKTGKLMMLPTDYILTKDESFKKYAKKYAEDQDAFFKDFSAVLAKLFELGVPRAQFVASEGWHMKTIDEQKA